MPRFKINPDQISDNIAVITGDDYRHIVKVLRYKTEDEITLFDNSGIEYACVIKDVAKDAVSAEITARYGIKTESPLKIKLFQSMAKGDKMDLIIQKTTELGVQDIYPIVSQRSDVKNTGKIPRWQKIADESIKQCGRVTSPVIHTEIRYSDIFDVEKSDLNLIFYENEESASLADMKDDSEVKSVSIIIGPEGGFSEDEVKQAESNGFVSVGLGPRILRAETASIAAVTLLQHIYGDI